MRFKLFWISTSTTTWLLLARRSGAASEEAGNVALGSDSSESSSSLWMDDAVALDDDGFRSAAAEEEEEEDTKTNEEGELNAGSSLAGDRNGSSSLSSSSAPASNKRLWGANPSSSLTEPPVHFESAADNNSHTAATPAPPSSFSFVTKPKASVTPPEAFEITARVYLDPEDGLAHLDEDSKISIPYWDCGVTGSTTSPLPVKDAAFRHSVTPTTPWTGTDGKHPLLAVALSPIWIETNSGESKAIKAGQVILLEDVLMAGHRLLPTQHQALQVLFLTLPQTHYHPGKDRVSLQTSTKTNFGNSPHNPCHLPYSNNGGIGNSSRRGVVSRLLTTTSIRRGILGVIGLSLSSLAAVFFGQTVPLWMAVGVGGIFFVSGGTWLTIRTGEIALTSIEIWLEQQRLATQSKGEPVVQEAEEEAEEAATKEKTAKSS